MNPQGVVLPPAPGQWPSRPVAAGPANPPGNANPPDSSTGQGQPGPAAAALPVAGFSQENLLTYAQEGREFYMGVALADIPTAGTMLGTKYYMTDSLKQWQSCRLLRWFVDNGWSEQDLSPQLSQSQFMGRLPGVFDRLVVGQAERSVARTQVQYLRKPSIEVWPTVPNRLILTVQDKSWKTDTVSSLSLLSM